MVSGTSSLEIPRKITEEQNEILTKDLMFEEFQRPLNKFTPIKHRGQMI